MPIFEYDCSACPATTTQLLPYGDKETAPVACPDCASPMAYAGLSAPTIGREQRFGAIMADGTRLRGNLNKEAPRRRAP